MPVESKKEKAIFQKALRSFELVVKSAQTFRAFLSDDHPAQSPDYYLARNFLRDAETLYEEAMAEAKKLLGPLPGYVSSQVASSKKAMLEAMSVVAKSADMTNLQSELERDDFESQRKGKRKLPNIKARMTLDKLARKLAQACELRERAQQKHQAPPASS
jgi:hypothetical protein